MALIYFYDSTELDKQQLSAGLEKTDHHWEFIKESISTDNIDPETEVISVFITSVVSKDIIESLPKLRLIACRSTGYNNVNLQAAIDRGITVLNVPTYGEETVAEYAFTLLLALSRKLVPTLRSFNEDIETHLLTGWDLNGKTIGVIGTGHIGKNVIKIAKGFSMQVIAYDAYPNAESANELGFNYVELDDLLKNSDVVTLHIPYFSSNYHLIDASKLALMKQSAVIINTARGELIDTKALTEALLENKIAGAALDVIEGERLMKVDGDVELLYRGSKVGSDMLEYGVEILALSRMKNVILTPHNAFNTIQAIERINNTTVKNIIDYWYGNSPNQVKLPIKTYGKLVLIRHSESEWNATGKWTGITDVHLSEKGFHDAGLLGKALESTGVVIDKAYCSQQIRTLETLEGVLDASSQLDVPIERSEAINERDYGDYTGKNKWEVRDMVGEEKFSKIRRGWEEPIPNGETLKQVYERALPFYKDIILPQIKDGKNILLVAHGNSLRCVKKYLESVSDQDIENLEMEFGEVIVYDVDDNGLSTSKKSTLIDAEPPKA